MTVYVDDLLRYPNAWGPFRGGSCHLTADSPDELHAFAIQIGMRRSWYQDHPVMPHYDLTRERRERALAHGAVYVPWREQARRRRALRRAAQVPQTVVAADGARGEQEDAAETDAVVAHGGRGR